MRGAEDRTAISVPLGLEPSTDTGVRQSITRGGQGSVARNGTQGSLSLPRRARLQDKGWGQGLGLGFKSSLRITGEIPQASYTNDETRIVHQGHKGNQEGVRPLMVMKQGQGETSHKGNVLWQ